MNLERALLYPILFRPEVVEARLDEIRRVHDRIMFFSVGGAGRKLRNDPLRGAFHENQGRRIFRTVNDGRTKHECVIRIPVLEERVFSGFFTLAVSGDGFVRIDLGPRRGSRARPPRGKRRHVHETRDLRCAFTIRFGRGPS